MLKAAWILGALAIVQFAGAQVLGSVYHNGSASATAGAYYYKYVKGGGPRSGYYWYWREYTAQLMSASNAIPLNGDSGQQLVKGTYYKPNVGAACDGLNSFTNTASQAVYTTYLSAHTTFAPTLAAHQAAAVSSQAYDELFFTLSSPTLVSITASVPSDAILWLKNLDSGDFLFTGFGNGAFSDTIDPGTYEMYIELQHSAYANTQTGKSGGLGTTSSLVKCRLVATPG